MAIYVIGHGSYDRDKPRVIVPAGTKLCYYAKEGDSLIRIVGMQIAGAGGWGTAEVFESGGLVHNYEMRPLDEDSVIAYEQVGRIEIDACFVGHEPRIPRAIWLCAGPAGCGLQGRHTCTGLLSLDWVVGAEIHFLHCRVVKRLPPAPGVTDDLPRGESALLPPGAGEEESMTVEAIAYVNEMMEKAKTEPVKAFEDLLALPPDLQAYVRATTIGDAFVKRAAPIYWSGVDQLRDRLVARRSQFTGESGDLYLLQYYGTLSEPRKKSISVPEIERKLDDAGGSVATVIERFDRKFANLVTNSSKLSWLSRYREEHILLLRSTCPKIRYWFKMEFDLLEEFRGQASAAGTLAEAATVLHQVSELYDHGWLAEIEDSRDIVDIKFKLYESNFLALPYRKKIEIWEKSVPEDARLLIEELSPRIDWAMQMARYLDGMARSFETMSGDERYQWWTGLGADAQKQMSDEIAGIADWVEECANPMTGLFELARRCDGGSTGADDLPELAQAILTVDMLRNHGLFDAATVLSRDSLIPALRASVTEFLDCLEPAERQQLWDNGMGDDAKEQILLWYPQVGDVLDEQEGS